jgi:tRNA (mo5U34)-methyltransferase
MDSTDTAERLIHSKIWHHDFEVIPGVWTHGSYNPSGLWNELSLPDDMAGLSLADVGASSGFFSFEARRRGARVVAFDIRHKDNSGFGLAQQVNGLHDITHHQVNVLDLNPDDYGRFDVVLAMGLLYHTADPYRALANCAALCSDRLIVESYCIDATLPEGIASQPIMRFIADPLRFPDQGQPNADRSNFWGFTAVCLEQMVRDVGFRVAHRRVHGDRVLIDARRDEESPGAVRLRLAYGLAPHVPVGDDPREPSSWTQF